jgi:hypothetical protein
LEALEGQRRADAMDLSHLSDEELEALTLDLIQRTADAGVVLPDDWRERYDRSCIRFLEWLDREVKELVECEA